MHFVHGVSDAELVELMGSAEVACVPSLYEGFSLPDRRADGLRDAAGRRRGPARIPEVVGPDGECADLVTPGDVGRARAAAVAELLDDPDGAPAMGAAGRAAGPRAVQLDGGGQGRPRARPTATRSATGAPHREETPC